MESDSLELDFNATELLEKHIEEINKILQYRSTIDPVLVGLHANKIIKTDSLESLLYIRSHLRNIKLLLREIDKIATGDIQALQTKYIEVKDLIIEEDFKEKLEKYDLKDLKKTLLIINNKIKLEISKTEEKTEEAMSSEDSQLTNAILHITKAILHKKKQ